MRDLHNTETPAQAEGVQVTGDPNCWELLSKASHACEGWMKSTKRMRVPGGWLYQVTTELRGHGMLACSDALTFVAERT